MTAPAGAPTGTAVAGLAPVLLMSAHRQRFLDLLRMGLDVTEVDRVHLADPDGPLPEVPSGHVVVADMLAGCGPVLPALLERMRTESPDLPVLVLSDDPDQPSSAVVLSPPLHGAAIRDAVSRLGSAFVAEPESPEPDPELVLESPAGPEPDPEAEPDASLSQRIPARDLAEVALPDNFCKITGDMGGEQEAAEPPAGGLWGSHVPAVLAAAAAQPGWEAATLDVVTRATAVAPADGALLVRRHGAWQVAASVGLRPIETALAPLDGHLVTRGDPRRPITVIPDTDAVRGQLSGAPLASRACLLVGTLAPVPAVLLLGRREGAFAPAEVKALATQLPQLRDAVDLALRWRETAWALLHLAG